MASEPPVLYHLAISHYSEKARWALSYKGINHLRRSTMGGLHNEYLVGDSFTVADLSAAALFYPAVLPPEGPDLPQPKGNLTEFREELMERPGYRWVQEMYSRHRGAP